MRPPLPAVAIVVFSAAASAHVADEIVVTLDEATLVETVTLTADTLAMLAPVDADGDGELTQGDLDARAEAIRLGVWEQARLQPCTRSNETARLEPGYVALKARFTCPPGELTQEFKWLMVLPSNYRVLFGNQIARGELRTLHVPRTEWKTRKLWSVTLGNLQWELAIIAVLALAALGFWLVRRRRA